MNYEAFRHWPTSLSRFTSQNVPLSLGTRSSDTDLPLCTPYLRLCTCSSLLGLLSLLAPSRKSSLFPLSVPPDTSSVGCPSVYLFLPHHCTSGIVMLSIIITCLGGCLFKDRDDNSSLKFLQYFMPGTELKW